jgi:hypothetical protein
LRWVRSSSDIPGAFDRFVHHGPGSSLSREMPDAIITVTYPVTGLERAHDFAAAHRPPATCQCRRFPAEAV